MMILFLPGIQYYCPAWDKVYEKDEFNMVIENSKEMLKSIEACGNIKNGKEL